MTCQTCHAVFLTGLSIIFLALVVVGFPVLVGIHVLQKSENQDQQARKALLPTSICHPSLQPACIPVFPDACSNTTCPFLPEAICIPDRCGCDAHFFLWDKKQQVYRNITERCIASTDTTENLKVVGTNASSSSRGLFLRKTVQLTRLKRAADIPEAEKSKRPRKSSQGGKGKGGGRLRKKKQRSSKRKRNNRRLSKGRRNKEQRRRGPHRKHKGKGKRPPPPDGVLPPDGEVPLPEIEGPSPEDDQVVPPPTEVNIIQQAPVDSPDPAVPSVVHVNVPASKESRGEKSANPPTTVIINTDGDGETDGGNVEAEVPSEEDSSSDKTESSATRK